MLDHFLFFLSKPNLALIFIFNKWYLQKINLTILRSIWSGFPHRLQHAFLCLLSILCLSGDRAALWLFVLLEKPDNHGADTWAPCPLQAGQSSSHHPLVCLPPASVLPASFPVAIVACHVSAGPRCSALSFNKSSYVLEGEGGEYRQE